MANWDVFHSDRLEVQRGLSSAEVRQALACGDLRDDDLIRPAGSSVPWGPLADSPALHESEHQVETRPAAKPEPQPPKAQVPAPPPERPKAAAPKPAPAPPAPAPPKPTKPPAVEKPAAAKTRPEPVLPNEDDLTFPATTEDLGVEQFGRGATEDLRLNALFEEPPKRKEKPLEAIIDEDDELKEAPLEAIIDDDGADQGAGDFSLDPRKSGDPRTRVTLPVEALEMESMVAEAVDDDELDPLDEDEEAAEFTLTRKATEKVEELDLAAMVDVAFQLVLFFLVTATTIMYKTLEVPTPKPDAPPGAVSQGQSKSLDELANDFILVEIDPQGSVKVDHEPAPGDMAGLADRLRELRSQTGRNKMLLSADANTMHRAAVIAYDAANEIGLGIAIARPTNTGMAPTPPPPAPPPAAGN